MRKCLKEKMKMVAEMDKYIIKQEIQEKSRLEESMYVECCLKGGRRIGCKSRQKE